MLESKPAHLIKFWKLSSDEEGNETVELITNNLETLTLDGHYVFLWKLINGFRSVQELITIFIEIFENNSKEDLANTVVESLQEMEKKELIILNWNPFS